MKIGNIRIVQREAVATILPSKSKRETIVSGAYQTTHKASNIGKKVKMTSNKINFSLIN